MVDDVVTHEDDALFERDDFDNGADPFAELMDLVPRDAEEITPDVEAAPAEIDHRPAEPVVAETSPQEPVESVPEMALDDDMSDALMAEFADVAAEDVGPIADNELYDAPAIIHEAPAAPVAPPIPQAFMPEEGDALDSFLMAEFEEPAPATETIADMPASAAMTLDDEITLDDLDLEDFSLAEIDATPEIATDMSGDGIEDALFAELNLDEPAPELSKPVAEIDIDDFLANEMDSIGDHESVLPEEPEEIIASQPSAPSISTATIAATTLGGASNGWLDSQPINVDSVAETVPPMESETGALDLLDDIELDIDDEINDFALDLGADDFEASVEVQPDAGPDPALEFADDDAVLDAQIKSLEESFDRPVLAVSEPELEPEPELNTISAGNTVVGAAVAGTVGLGLSRVFGGQNTAVNEAPASPATDAEPEMHALDDVLSEMDFADAQPPQAPDDLAIDLALGDLDLMPELNTVELGGVPVTDTISVPHVDYDMQASVAETSDDFEQAISDSFSDMQDNDLLANNVSAENNLDIDLSNLDFELDGATDVAYDQLLAEEGVQEEVMFDEQAFADELDNSVADDLALGDIRFDDDDIAGLREESGSAAYSADARTMPLSEMTGMAAAHRTAKKPRNRKGLLIAACLGGVALIAGVVGIGSQFFGSGDGTETAMIIPADTADVKMVPSEQSGLQVPNQDRAVFNESATTTTSGEQGSLVDGREPLVDGVKDTDRINPTDTEQSDAAKALEDAAQSVMTPRRVQTLVVKPDGTLAPAGEATIAPVANEPSANDADRLLPSTANEGVGADIASAPQQVVRTVTVREGETPQITANPTPRPVQPQVQPQVQAPRTPEVAPLVPSRPANQPVNIVDQNNNAQVAVAAPARPAVTAGTYFVQIASQPSEADARASGNTLTRRFANVVGGRGFVIQRAVIEGKGTFFRVRVPAGTRAEANALCSRYKSAGGSCFISR